MHLLVSESQSIQFAIFVQHLPLSGLKNFPSRQPVQVISNVEEHLLQLGTVDVNKVEEQQTKLSELSVKVLSHPVQTVCAAEEHLLHLSTVVNKFVLQQVNLSKLRVKVSAHVLH